MTAAPSSSASGYVAKFGFLSIVTVMIAIWMNQDSNPNNMEATILDTLDSLMKAEKKVEVNAKPRVAIGLGGCMDVFVDALDFFEKMNLNPNERAIHHDIIHNEQELSEGFLSYFQHGAAGERYVRNKNLFRKMTDTAATLPSWREAIGGNAPVMANRMASEGAEVLLASQGASAFKQQLHSNVQLAGSEVEHDDIHLILEYKTGDRIGQFQSPRANRYIAISDEHNPHLDALEGFIQHYREFDPRLVVVGGLQVMDGYEYSGNMKETRLQSLKDFLTEVNDDGKLVHFEMASFVDEDLFGDLMHYVLPHSDSLGMNEQELPNILNYLRHGNLTMVADAYPRVASTLDEMRGLYTLLRHQSNRVSRIHVHTIAFQAIMTSSVTSSLQWKNTMSAAAHASLVANRHVCGKQEVDIETSKMLLDESFSTTVDRTIAERVHFSPTRPVSCWEETLEGDLPVLICVAPNLVCTKIFQTAGGGDNISAAGLLFQI